MVVCRHMTDLAIFWRWLQRAQSCNCWLQVLFQVGMQLMLSACQCNRSQYFIVIALGKKCYFNFLFCSRDAWNLYVSFFFKLDFWLYKWYSPILLFIFHFHDGGCLWFFYLSYKLDLSCSLHPKSWRHYIHLFWILFLYVPFLCINKSCFTIIILPGKI